MENDIIGEASRARPQPKGDTIRGRLRLDRYRGIYTSPRMSGMQNLIDEGSYFIGANPTPGTGIAYGSAGTQAAFANTVPFMLFKNNAGPTAGIRSFIRKIKLIQFGGTAPATTTSVQASVQIDKSNRFFTSATTTYQQITLFNPNGGDDTQPQTQLWVPNGAVATIPAPQSPVVTGRCQLKGGPTLLLDEYTMLFGQADSPPQGGYLTTVGSYVHHMPGFALDPQQFGVVHLWFPGGATNPFTFEFETEVIEC